MAFTSDAFTNITGTASDPNVKDQHPVVLDQSPSNLEADDRAGRQRYGSERHLVLESTHVTDHRTGARATSNRRDAVVFNG